MDVHAPMATQTVGVTRIRVANMSPAKYLALAASYAMLDDARNFWLGAAGLRADGALVRARNGPSKQVEPSAHAETRLIRKLDLGATVFVARISRATGQWALAKPCEGCKYRLLAKGVKKIYYTIGPNEYGVIQ